MSENSLPLNPEDSLQAKLDLQKLKTRTLKEELKLREEHLFEMEKSNSKNQQKVLEELQTIIEKRQELESLLQSEKQCLNNLEIAFSEIQLMFLERDNKFESYESQTESIRTELCMVNKEISSLKARISESLSSQKKYQDLCETSRKDFDFGRGQLKNKFLAEKKEIIQKNRVLTERLKMEENTLGKFEKENHALNMSISEIKLEINTVKRKIQELKAGIEDLNSKQTQIKETEKFNKAKVFRAEISIDQ
jgi:hypothetical protein